MLKEYQTLRRDGIIAVGRILSNDVAQTFGVSHRPARKYPLSPLTLFRGSALTLSFSLIGEDTSHPRRHLTV